METFNSLFMVSPAVAGSSLFVAMLAGFIDSIAGGGGLLTIPALMAAGMSPANALATNKLQSLRRLYFRHYLLYSPQSGWFKAIRNSISP